jgi:hypothetical protein
MFITTSYKLKQLLGWLRGRIRWFKEPLFKSKNTRPESPKQEISTSSNQNDVVLQSLDVKDKQEQTQWFQKKNDLRDVHFDLNPVWNNHQLYGTSDAPGDDFYRFKTKEELDEYRNGLEEELLYFPADIKAVKGQEEEYKDDIPKTYSPWDDFEKFPKKDYHISGDDLSKLSSSLNENNNHHYDTEHHNDKG